MIYIAIFALIVSFVSLGVAVTSFRRTKTLQNFEYSTRLQLVDEQMNMGSTSLRDRPALRYIAKIENRGSKTVKISSLYLDYGDREDPNKRIQYLLGGEMYLSPGKDHPISKEITWELVDEMKKRYNINQCFFFLRVAHHSVDNGLQENTRALCGFDGASTCIILQRGETL